MNQRYAVTFSTDNKVDSSGQPMVHIISTREHTLEILTKRGFDVENIDWNNPVNQLTNGINCYVTKHACVVAMGYDRETVLRLCETALATGSAYGVKMGTKNAKSWLETYVKL